MQLITHQPVTDIYFFEAVPSVVWNKKYLLSIVALPDVMSSSFSLQFSVFFLSVRRGSKSHSKSSMIEVCCRYDNWSIDNSVKLTLSLLDKAWKWTFSDIVLLQGRLPGARVTERLAPFLQFWIWLLCLTRIDSWFTRLVRSKPVKQGVICTMILPLVGLPWLLRRINIFAKVWGDPSCQECG